MQTMLSRLADLFPQGIEMMPGTSMAFRTNRPQDGWHATGEIEMSLAERLDSIRAGAATRVPPEQRALMSRATEELRHSGILDGVIKPGAKLPDFALANAQGTTVRSDALLAQGPLVLTVFRGSW
jgi:hypothetical protein